MNKAVLGVVLAAAVLAVVFAPPAEDDDVVAVAVRPATAGSQAKPALQTQPPSASGGYQLQIKPRRWDLPADSDSSSATPPAPIWGSALFTATNWAPPPPPPPKPVKLKVEKPPPPTAPPLPFRYLGRWVEDGQVSYFLQQNEGNLVVKVGDKIGPSYQLQSAQAGQLHFIYLPLQQTQTLAVGEVN